MSAIVPTRINPGRDRVRSANTVLTGRVRTYHEPGFRTTLSIKSVRSGHADYATSRGRAPLDPGVFTVLNPGQEYTLDIEVPPGDPETHTLAIFFAPGFVEGVADVLARTHDSLLGDPEPDEGDVEFVERLYPKTGPVADALDRVAGALDRRPPGAEPPDLEGHFHDLAEALLDLNGQVRAEIDALPAKRPSTRRELYDRLHRARDFLHAEYAAPLTIDRMAREARMAPFHFLRTWRAAFGHTPLRALQARRMEVARELLTTTDLPVQAVCRRVGLRSAPSFARQFRRTFGTSPRDLRRAERG